MKAKTKYILLIIIISAFGPYIFPNSGIRLEHLVIYSLFFVFAFSLIIFRFPIPKVYLTLSLLWFLMLVWCSFITLGYGISFIDYNVLAAFENIFQPIAIIMVIGIIVRIIPATKVEETIFTVANLLVTLLIINTLWIILGLYVDLTPINLYFWEGRGVQITSVAQRAASMGRYSGIFNQPLESGLLYSLGLLSWAHMAAAKKKISVLNVISLVLLVVGGVFSVSKVFIFGGLPLFILYMLEEKGTIFINYLKYLLIIPLAFAVDWFYNHYWTGYSLLLRFGQAVVENRLFQVIFATRYGSSGTGVMRNFEYTWIESPLYGFGFGVQTAFDNSYLEVFMYGGLIALLFYVSIFFVLLSFIFTHYSKKTKPMAKTLIFMLVFIAIAGTGGPTMIANRFSILFWVFTCLLLYGMKICNKVDEVKQVDYYEKRNFTKAI